MLVAQRIPPTWRFAARFFGALVLWSVFAWAVVLPERLGAVQSFLARSAAGIASWVGATAAVSGDQIFTGSLRIDITFECTGIYVAMILVSFLLAYPATARARLAGIAVGLTGLTALNVLRLAFLVGIAQSWPGLFDLVHEYLWQGLLLLAVILYAMAWAERVR